MNCPKCGCYCSDRTHKCPKCGAEVREDAGTPIKIPAKYAAIESAKESVGIFSNVGKVLQYFAIVTFVLGIIAAIIYAFVLFGDEDTFLLGVLCLILGPLVSFLSSATPYAIGYIFDAVNDIRSRIK